MARTTVATTLEAERLLLRLSVLLFIFGGLSESALSIPLLNIYIEAISVYRRVPVESTKSISIPVYLTTAAGQCKTSNCKKRRLTKIGAIDQERKLVLLFQPFFAGKILVGTMAISDAN